MTPIYTQQLMRMITKFLVFEPTTDEAGYAFPGSLWIYGIFQIEYIPQATTIEIRDAESYSSATLTKSELQEVIAQLQAIADQMLP